jgi:hypothetical protein
VDQISPPFRIALVALLAVCALWFTVLKPKAPGDDAPPPAVPGATGLAGDVSAAKGAAAASDAANAATQAATGGTEATASKATPTAKPAKPGAAKPAPKGPHAAVAGKNANIPSATRAPANPSAPLLRALDRGHAVVLLFWSRTGSADRAVRRAVAATSRRHGDVVVKVASVKDVARYAPITRGVQILQSPTVLVLTPGRKARPIVGFTTTGEIDQAVGDALAGVKSGK